MILQNAAQSAKSTLLRRTLQTNGVFSGLSGIVLIAGATQLTSLLGLDTHLILIVVGVVCILYAASLFFNTTQKFVDPAFAWFAIIVDSTWVLGSLIILFTGWPALTSTGWWAVAIVADIVAVFAILQFVGLRRQQ
ncbi:MAG: hypothetical protein HYR94_19715 [Chloroflexi bacterium]|nr:hypothetical protein [Chloroflexota bacterium]